MNLTRRDLIAAGKAGALGMSFEGMARLSRRGLDPGASPPRSRPRSGETHPRSRDCTGPDTRSTR